jgi:MSHA pilin protein MshD
MSIVAIAAESVRRTSSIALVHGRGFTLIELIVTMLIISIAALGVTYSLSLGLRHQSDALWQAKTVALAEAYLEEILARRYDENSPSGGVPPCTPSSTACSAPGAFNDGEIRAEYDDVDDYDGLVEQPPRDVSGNPRPDYDSYRVAISVAYSNPAQIAALGLDSATDAKLVTVTVSTPEGGSMSFNALRGNF